MNDDATDLQASDWDAWDDLSDEERTKGISDLLGGILGRANTPRETD